MVELSCAWEQVDGMTLPQVAALSRHFQRVPPLRVSLMAIAKGLGVTFPGTAPDNMTGPEFAELPEFEDG